MRNLVGWGAAAAVVLSVLAGTADRALAATSNLIVHVYNTGQGSCVLVECPDDLPILVDCGKMGSGDIIGAARKINTVLDGYSDYYQPLRVLLSHGDVDHYSLLSGKSERGVPLLDPKRVRQVYFGGAYADYGTAKKWINEAHKSLSFPSRDYPVDRACDDTSFRISCLQPNETAWGSIRSVSCGKAKLDLLTANAQAYYRAHADQFVGTRWETDGRKNADSAVVRVSYEGVSFIFPGDAQEITEQMILRNAQAAGVSLAGTGFLFGSHHGAWRDGSNGEAWIRGTAPRNVVFSANKAGGYGHPTCIVVTRFDMVADVSLTDAPGRMPVRCDRDAEVSSFKNRFLVTEATGDITITVQVGRPPEVVCEIPTKGCAW